MRCLPSIFFYDVAIKNFTIELDEPAERADGSFITDHEVRARLVSKGFENTEKEWMRCSLADVQTVLTELRTGQKLSGTHHLDFPMRQEQAEAVEQELLQAGLTEVERRFDLAGRARVVGARWTG